MSVWLGWYYILLVGFLLYRLRFEEEGRGGMRVATRLGWAETVFKDKEKNAHLVQQSCLFRGPLTLHIVLSAVVV